jgi:hypothetical protein
VPLEKCPVAGKEAKHEGPAAEKTSRHRKILQTGQRMPQSRLVQSPWHANCTDVLEVPGSHNKTVKNVCTTSGIDSQEDEEQDNEEGFDR